MSRDKCGCHVHNRPLSEHKRDVTNSNASKHHQPDRLKLLFRDHRGYRAMSEQKVSEWLSNNKQFYNVIPKDLTEIPEHIFNPSEKADTEWRQDRSTFMPPKSENSVTNRHSRNLDSEDIQNTRTYRDKMNHFFQKTVGSKPVRNSSHLMSKSNRQSIRSQKRQRLFDPPATSSEESASCKSYTRNHELTYGSSRQHKSSAIRRDSHSMVPKGSVHNKRQSECLPVNANYTTARKTLPTTLQNNSFNRPKNKTANTYSLEPIRSLTQAFSLKRPSISRPTTVSANIPKREKNLRRINFMPVNKYPHYQLDTHNEMLHRMQRSRSQSTAWRSPYAMKKLHRFATMWLGGTDKSGSYLYTK